MTRLAIIALPLFLLGTPGIAAAQDYVQVAAGVDYSSGDYGETEDTDFLALPLTLKVKRGDFDIRVTLPYLDVTGPANVIPGDGGVPGGNGGEIASRSGIGDVVLAATYSLAIGDATWFDTTGKVKFPTASTSKALGTGTTDFTVEGELLHSFGALSAAVRGGRRFNGSSDTYPLQDVWLAGGGLYLALGDTTLGLDYDWRDGSLPTSPNRSEITGSVTHKLNDRLRLQGYAYSGLADGSPDIGGGAQILYRFGM
ncbi:hypothetical protein [Erythrobacter mangrovi]|uniref:Transporter n=1 Tax=Erythrobacter mangrovi TaxID=2739433 RepID=A0A7D4BB82_9SPHN|nr:hypothetical protein [Erythrobacter mangrovi]QKG72001.1 hypothetical protein HQR01_11840 [Erythrobacter mangrovi]